MPRKQTKEAHVSIPPVASPSMDRPSIAFAWFLDRVVFTELGGFYTMDCVLCSATICDLTDGDSLRIMLNTALAHDCE